MTGEPAPSARSDPPASVPTVPEKAAPQRAHGRALADFGTLFEAEEKLLTGCRTGDVAMIADKRPDEESAVNRVRGGFVRFLLLGGNDEAPVHEKGVQLMGAWLTDDLDLNDVAATRPLVLFDCRLAGLTLGDGSLPALALIGCRLSQGIIGDRVRCASGVFLRNVDATGEVRLTGAKIGGDLSCSGGRFENAGGNALSFDGAKIDGSAFLDDGFQAEGEVRLIGATIGIGLVCRGGRFDNAGNTALSFDGASIGGGAFLDTGFHASGTVLLAGATIGGTLNCEGGQFDAADATAIQADGATIKAGLFFRGVEAITGAIDLTSASTANLVDDRGSWRKASYLFLDGFTYGRIAAGPTDAASRILWLDRQKAEHLTADFRPQPWEQAIKVLREMGHFEDARLVAIAKQERLRAAGKFRGVARSLHRLYGWLVGYGHRPLRLVGRVGAAWLILTLAFWAGANPGAFGSTTHLIAPTRAGTDAACPAGPGKEQCERLPPDYRSFFAPAYAADLLVPVINLGYKAQWQPRVSIDGKPLYGGHVLRVLAWAGIVFGWVASLLLVGVLGNLIKKD